MATDQRVARAAVKDAASKQCYKALAAMHDAFGRLGVNVQEIANAASAKNELEAKAAELAARNTAEAIEKISADLKAIKLENAKLKADAN